MYVSAVVADTEALAEGEVVSETVAVDGARAER